MTTPRRKILAATGVLAGALGVTAVNGALAAPTPGATPSPAPTSENTAWPIGFQIATQIESGPGKRVAIRLGGAQIGKSLADFLGVSVQQLQQDLQNGQTLAQITQAHNKSTADLKTFLYNQQKSQLDQAVSSGKLTAAQESQILNAFQNHEDQVINTKLPLFTKDIGPIGPMGVQLEAAKYLQMTPQQMMTALQNGQTLAQIAQAHGKSQADLKSYLVNQYSTSLDKILNQKLTDVPKLAVFSTATAPTVLFSSR